MRRLVPRQFAANLMKSARHSTIDDIQINPGYSTIRFSILLAIRYLKSIEDPI